MYNCSKSNQLYSKFMLATDLEIIEICQERNISYTDADGFNRQLAVLNIFQYIVDKKTTDEN